MVAFNKGLHITDAHAWIVEMDALTQERWQYPAWREQKYFNDNFQSNSWQQLQRHHHLRQL